MKIDFKNGQTKKWRFWLILVKTIITLGSIVCSTTFVGGIAAQEIVKAISNKYTPLNQMVNEIEKKNERNELRNSLCDRWEILFAKKIKKKKKFYFDGLEIIPPLDSPIENFVPRNSRYDAQGYMTRYVTVT